MKKKLYFLEKTMNVDGFYLEFEITQVTKNKKKALSTFKRLTEAETTGEYGYTLNEYTVESSKQKLSTLIRNFSQLPINFFKNLHILNFIPLKEYQPIAVG